MIAVAEKAFASIENDSSGQFEKVVANRRNITSRFILQGLFFSFLSMLGQKRSWIPLNATEVREHLETSNASEMASRRISAALFVSPSLHSQTPKTTFYFQLFKRT